MTRQRPEVLTNWLWSCVHSVAMITIFCALTVAALGQNPQVVLEAGAADGPWPKADAGYVTDLAGSLSHDEEELIEQRLWITEEKTGVEIAVMTIQSIHDFPGTPQNSIEEFATGLFNHYSIGRHNKNDGVLMLVAVNDRDMRIELGAGYDQSRNADAKRIIEETVLPHFRRGEMSAGIQEGVADIQQEFAGVTFGRRAWLKPSLLVGAIVALSLITISLFRQGKRGWGWVCVGLLIVLLLYTMKVIGSLLNSSDHGDSGGWSSGGFGGGFGGGFSSGGGASGSW